MREDSPSGPRHTAVVGLQWGDEGKGKIVDLLTARHDVIVRYNGGANAGHTVVADGERYALHLIPAGILYPDKRCVIANGVVVDPEKLVEEIDALRDRGVEVGDNLRVSNRAHVVLPYHKALDAALENWLADCVRSDGSGGQGAIGTTKRGIGPAYADKILRSTAIRVGDLLDPDGLRDRLGPICDMHAAQIDALNGLTGITGEPTSFDPDELTAWGTKLGRRLAPFVTDTAYLLHDHLAAGRSLLFEGANACLLDVDHGTYPFVTSSNSSTLGAAPGTGVPMRNVDRVVGIMKAYATRVGSGPFPTELDDAVGDRIRDRGHEYGTTTGRPRRCGWLDLVAVRYSAMICGVTSLSVMLLDVLSSFDELRVCTQYRLPDGSLTDRFVPDARQLVEMQPVYETLPGWQDEIVETTDRAGLPDAAKAYLDCIEAFVGVPVEIVSVGPDRAQTMAV